MKEVANFANDKTDRLRETANKGGEGVQNPENSANVINGCPLITTIQWLMNEEKDPATDILSKSHFILFKKQLCHDISCIKRLSVVQPKGKEESEQTHTTLARPLFRPSSLEQLFPL